MAMFFLYDYCRSARTNGVMHRGKSIEAREHAE